MELTKNIVRKANVTPMFIFRIVNKLIQLENWLMRNHQLYNKTDYSPFFIIGSGRSGNTLLRSMLVANTDISIPPESYVLQSVYRQFQLYKNLPWKDLSKIIISEFDAHKQFYHWQVNINPVYQEVVNLPKKNRTLAAIVDKVYRQYTTIHFPKATIWGDKTPMNTLYLNWINKIFPEAKYIHIIRDGRDVVSSYVQAGIYGDVNDACWRWMESIKRARSFGQKLGNKKYMEIRYENMVSNSEYEIKRICKFLGIAFQKEMLKSQKNASKLGDATGMSHHRNLYKPINRSSIGKWKKTLNYQDQVFVQNTLLKMLKELDYKCE